jgi:hypothetical protein
LPINKSSEKTVGLKPEQRKQTSRRAATDAEEARPAPASSALLQGLKPEELPTQRENSRRPAPSVTSAVDPFAILKPGEMVVECPPLSAEDTDTTGPAIRLLQKLGFGAEWPSPSFPIRTDVREELGRARRVVEARGVLVDGDPLNPLADGKSWVMPCKLPDELSKREEAPDLVRQWLESEGVKVAARPVLDGETLLIPLWDSGKDCVAEIDRSDSGNADGQKHEVAAGNSRELLQFMSRGDEIVVASCNDMETAVANTHEDFIPYMGQVKSIVRSRRGKVTVTELRRRFKNTYFVKALDSEDWKILIEEVSRKRSAGPGNLTIALLARRTGLSNETVATYTRPSRKRKKAAS